MRSFPEIIEIRSVSDKNEVPNVEVHIKKTEYSLFKTSAFISLSIYIFWILVGTIFYVYYENFSIGTAYFYTLEAGLSIGFCNPSDKDNPSRIFTICLVLCGSSIVAGAIGAFASRLSEPKVSMIHDSSGMSGGPKREDSQWYICYLLRSTWYRIKVALLWYSHRTYVKLTIALVLWLLIGAAYGMTMEKWDFITSLYWAVTTVSTGGLQSPTCLGNFSGAPGEICDIGTTRGFLMGTYMLIGVPLYALCLGKYGNIFASYALQQHNYKQLQSPIKEEEFLYACNLLSPPGSVTLNLGEYILLELMRVGSVDAETIQELKDRFLYLDNLISNTRNSGTLDLDDMIRIHAVLPPDGFKRNELVVMQAMHRNSSAYAELDGGIELGTRMRRNTSNSSLSKLAAERESRESRLGIDVYEPSLQVKGTGLGMRSETGLGSGLGTGQKGQNSPSSLNEFEVKCEHAPQSRDSGVGEVNAGSGDAVSNGLDVFCYSNCRPTCD